MADSKSTIHVVVPDRVHQMARLRAVERRLTLKDYIAAVIIEEVERHQQKAAQEASEHA